MEPSKSRRGWGLVHVDAEDHRIGHVLSVYHARIVSLSISS